MTTHANSSTFTKVRSAKNQRQRLNNEGVIKVAANQERSARITNQSEFTVVTLSAQFAHN